MTTFLLSLLIVFEAVRLVIEARLIWRAIDLLSSSEFSFRCISSVLEDIKSSEIERRVKDYLDKGWELDEKERRGWQ